MRDQLLEKISSLELRTKLFEEPNIQLAAAIDKARAWETARRQASSIAEGEGGQSNVNMIKDVIARNPQLDLVSANVMHVARWDILLVTKYVQLGVKRVLNVVIEDTGQLVVGVRLRVRRVVRRVAEAEMGERVAIDRDIPGIPNMIQNQGTGKLIKYNVTVEMRLLHSLSISTGRGL